MHAAYLPDERAFIRYVEIPGADPPLLWLHGWQCSSTGELLPAAVQEPLRGRRMLVIDLLGHGYSDRPRDFGYSPVDHARTIVAIIDGLGILDCGIVGHSMGGGIAVHVAAARPAVVSVVVLAEGALGDERDRGFEGTEEAFVQQGFGELLAGQRSRAEADPAGLVAAHLGITQANEPRALYREDLAMTAGSTPSIRELLAGLAMPRWYLMGELSDPEGLEAEMASIGVGWKVVPATGHPMGIQNPAGFASAVAEVVEAAWPA